MLLGKAKKLFFSYFYSTSNSLQGMRSQLLDILGGNKKVALIEVPFLALS